MSESSKSGVNLETGPRPAGEAIVLRALAKEALERLAKDAEQLSRRDLAGYVSLAPALERVSHRIDAYCEHLACAVEPALARRQGPSSVLLDHFERFRRRQRSELAKLAALVRGAPCSANTAQAVLVSAMVLRADLDAHAQDLTLVRAVRDKHAA